MTVSIVLLYFGFDFLKGTDFFSSNKKYYAVYDNIDKLAPSNMVYLNGVVVGRVSETIIQQERDRVVVELEIDSDIILGESTVAILSGDFLGNKYILLDIGPLTGRRLEAKDTLRTALDKGIAEVLAQAAPVADNLQTTLRKLNTVLDNLANNTQKLDKIFADLSATPNRINATIAKAGQDLGELSSTYKKVGDNINHSLEELKPVLRNFRSVSDSLRDKDLSGSLVRAQQALESLSKTLARLNSGDNTASRLLTEDSLYVRINNLVLNLDSLATHFNQYPRHFMAPLGKSRKKIEREIEAERKRSSAKQ